jgi:hypothetical protein
LLNFADFLEKMKGRNAPPTSDHSEAFAGLSGKKGGSVPKQFRKIRVHGDIARCYDRRPGDPDDGG